MDVAVIQSDTRVLSVVIPAYNEEKTISTVLTKLAKLDIVKEIIVVDDGSSDATRQMVQQLDSPLIRIIEMPSNQGKTAAVCRGLEEVQGEITIIQDADLEYDPEEIPDIIEPIMEGRADVVYGSRFLVRKATRVLYFYHFLANKALTFISNLFTNLNMTDIETCYKAFRTPLVKNLSLRSRGFGMEVEITALIAKTSARVYEVPISYYGRTYEEGKKIGFKDGIMALWYIVNFNMLSSKSKSTRDYVEKINEWLKTTSGCL
jgi:glycosyltransferase involved in cell wall biosynthesis